MQNPILNALRSSRMLPTPHWQPRCDLCRLRRTHPDAYDWLTSQLLDGALTQEEIAAEISRRTGLAVEQPQVSRHKTRHLDPTVRDAYETFIGRTVMLQALGDMPPEEMAVAYAQLALLDLGKRLPETSHKDASGIAAGIAALSRAVQSGVKLPRELAAMELENAAAEARQAQAEDSYQEAFARYVERHYPELVGKLAAAEGQAQPGPAAAEVHPDA